MERVKFKAAFFASVYSDVERSWKQITSSDLFPRYCVWLVFNSTKLDNVPKSLGVVSAVAYPTLIATSYFLLPTFCHSLLPTFCLINSNGANIASIRCLQLLLIWAPIAQIWVPQLALMIAQPLVPFTTSIDVTFGDFIDVTSGDAIDVNAAILYLDKRYSRHCHFRHYHF